MGQPAGLAALPTASENLRFHHSVVTRFLLGWNGIFIIIIELKYH